MVIKMFSSFNHGRVVKFKELNFVKGFAVAVAVDVINGSIKIGKILASDQDGTMDSADCSLMDKV